MKTSTIILAGGPSRRFGEDKGLALLAGKPLIDLIKLLEGEDNNLTDLHLVRPTLEDVFIMLTGRRIRD